MTSSDFLELLRCQRDPWRFLTAHVVTQDPKRGALAYPDYPYLRELIQAGERHKFLLVPKSRQMMVTWTMVACTIWRALLRGPGVYLFLSRNERCAEELLTRVRFILDRLPDSMRPRLARSAREEIAFAGLDSRILSLPATPDTPRMYSPSGVFWDEMAFTPYDEEIWSALKPALDSGGRFVGVSSSGGALNLFARMVTSEMTNKEYCHSGHGAASSSLIASRSSLFHIHRIHYLQHPEKKSEEWKRNAARGLSATRWKQEQEISFETTSDLVYDCFDSQRHILREEWKVRPDWEIFRALDFGFRHPFVLWIQRSPENEFIVFDEWSGENRTTDEMREAIRNVDLLHGISEERVRFSACDPAGAAAQDSGLSPVDILRATGMKLRYRSSRIAPGIECVRRAFLDAAGKTSLRISPRCRSLLADLGRYRWAAGRDEPLKDGLCDHSMDALRYFFVNHDTPQTELALCPRLAGIHRR
ncbi:MAG: hypothetical protein PHI18_09195, partial [bacterium]|nr:hypothetical protein [bacterium]